MTVDKTHYLQDTHSIKGPLYFLCVGWVSQKKYLKEMQSELQFATISKSVLLSTLSLLLFVSPTHKPTLRVCVFSLYDLSLSFRFNSRSGAR